MKPVVTGMGVVAPTGSTVAEYWASTLRGDSGIGRISRFDATPYRTVLAGEVREFTAADHLSSRLVVQTDRWTQFGLVAANMALADAGALPVADTGLDAYDLAVVTASSTGGNEFGQGELGQLWSVGPQRVTPFQSIAWFYAATTGQISILHGMQGPCGVLVSEQAGGLDAVAQARRVLAGGARLAVTGGGEAPLSPYAMVCQQATGMLSTADQPHRGYLPFTAHAAGYVPAEGGAMLILEPERSAAERGAPHRYGRIAGYAATFDPKPGSDRGPGLARAITGALADAQCGPEEVDVVFADAGGTPELDRVEADALVELFGPYGVPVTAPKVMTGRMNAGGAVLDLVTALLAIRDGVIPPTPGIRALPEYRLDLVGEQARPARLHTALVLARGYGGFNSAMVVTA